MYLFDTYKIYNTIKLFSTIIFILAVVNSTHALPANEISIKARQNEAAKSSIYILNFAVNQEISTKAMVIITFPDNFDLTGVLIAGSSTIDGGFKVTVEQSQVTIKRTGLGKIIKPNEKVEIKFANVTNPSEPADSYNIKIDIKNNNNNNIFSSKQTIKIIANKNNR